MSRREADQRGGSRRAGWQRERSRRERLKLNPIACDAHGLCADLLPEMITLDEWGYPIVDERPVPPHLLAHARRVVTACPTLALALTSADRAGTHTRQEGQMS